MNIYFRLWLRFTVWMIQSDKFSYSHLTRSEIEQRLRSYKQGWPWVDAHLIALTKDLTELVR